MTSEQFSYWLQGYFEVGQPKTLDEQQVQIIKDHLDLVFNKVTPTYKKPSNPPLCRLNPPLGGFAPKTDVAGALDVLFPVKEETTHYC
jgi:hypothetical protein